MFVIADGASFSSMILIRFFLSLRIAFCIGKTSAKCVLHNKNQGFFTHSTFYENFNFCCSVQIPTLILRIVFGMIFNDVSKFLEM